MAKPLIFLSFDIEADGPAPGLNSMLSLGFVGINEEGKFVFQYEANLNPLPDAKPNAGRWSGGPNLNKQKRGSISILQDAIPK